MQGWLILAHTKTSERISCIGQISSECRVTPGSTLNIDALHSKNGWEPIANLVVL